MDSRFGISVENWYRVLLTTFLRTSHISRCNPCLKSNVEILKCVECVECAECVEFALNVIKAILKTGFGSFSACRARRTFILGHISVL